MSGFGWANPAYTGQDPMSNEDYIATCPEDWQPYLKLMAAVLDDVYKGEWRISQVKTKFGDATIYLQIPFRTDAVDRVHRATERILTQMMNEQKAPA